MESKIPMPICRPILNNRFIGNFDLWTVDNYIPLLKYFEALCKIPLEDSQENVKFQVWLAIQHECEVINHAH